MKRLHIALVYNAYTENAPELPEDRGGTSDLRTMVRNTARTLRRLGHTVVMHPLADDLFAFQRKLRRHPPNVVFNLYDDVVQGALYDMRLAALVRMMNFPLTGSPALALGLTRYKFMSASLLSGLGIPIPASTAILADLVGIGAASATPARVITRSSGIQAGARYDDRIVTGRCFRRSCCNMMQFHLRQFAQRTHSRHSPFSPCETSWT